MSFFFSLRSMSHVTTYPATLKQLDLSHNSITVWPSLPQVEALDEHIQCYSSDPQSAASPLSRHSGCGLRNIVLHSLCTHRRHVKLDNLRTLVLADNCLDRIILTSDDDDADWVSFARRALKGVVLCYNSSMTSRAALLLDGVQVKWLDGIFYNTSIGQFSIMTLHRPRCYKCDWLGYRIDDTF